MLLHGIKHQLTGVKNFHSVKIWELSSFTMWAEGNSKSEYSILNPMPPAFQRAQKVNPAKMPCQNDLKGGKKVARRLEGNLYSRSKKQF